MRPSVGSRRAHPPDVFALAHPTLPSRTSSIAPAARFCARVLFPSLFTFVAATPRLREWRNAERRTALECRAGKARRHACEAWAPPGATGRPTSRRSAVACRPVPALPFPALPPGPARRPLGHQALVPGRGSRPAVAVTSRDDATSRCAFRIASRKRPSRAGFRACSTRARSSQYRRRSRSRDAFRGQRTPMHATAPKAPPPPTWRSASISRSRSRRSA
jgi:hypothetical protein